VLIRTNYDIIPFNWRGRNIVNMLSRSICNIVKDGHRWKAAFSSSAALSSQSSPQSRSAKRPRYHNVIVSDLSLLANSNRPVFAARRFIPTAIFGAVPSSVRHFSTTNARSTETASGTTSIAEAASTVTTGEAKPNLIDGKEELILDWIPEKPVPTEELLNLLGEPTLHSLGLASWWPSGRMQYLMEQIHLYLDIPWWGSIMLTAVLLRIVVFPTVVWAQRNAAKMNDVAPQMQVLQEKMTEAKARGDVYEQSVLGGELQQFMKKHDVSPFKNFYPILMQAPFFMSMFMGLRGMANLPVPSMETESFLWISDLSLRDPYFLTPIFISGTMYLQFYLAADGANLQQMGPIAKGVMRIVPIGLFFITFKFPAALTIYWSTANVISVLQASLVRQPAVRKKLGIPEFKRHRKTGKSQKGFVQSVREAIDNSRNAANVADRRQYDEQKFREAGMTKPQRTFKFDPTKPFVKRKI